jgi:hypothetical protein
VRVCTKGSLNLVIKQDSLTSSLIRSFSQARQHSHAILPARARPPCSFMHHCVLGLDARCPKWTIRTSRPPNNTDTYTLCKTHACMPRSQKNQSQSVLHWTSDSTDVSE